MQYICRFSIAFEMSFVLFHWQKTVQCLIFLFQFPLQKLEHKHSVLKIYSLPISGLESIKV